MIGTVVAWSDSWWVYQLYGDFLAESAVSTRARWDRWRSRTRGRRLHIYCLPASKGIGLFRSKWTTCFSANLCSPTNIPTCTQLQSAYAVGNSMVKFTKHFVKYFLTRYGFLLFHPRNSIYRLYKELLENVLVTKCFCGLFSWSNSVIFSPWLELWL